MVQDKTNVINRLKRIEGQVRGIIKMVDSDKDCKSIVTQMTATKAALERALGYVVAKNLESCIYDKIHNGEDVDEAIKEAVDMVTRNMY